MQAATLPKNRRAHVEDHVGDTLAEREVLFGTWEAMLHDRFPEHQLIVRNLAYSADNPLGWSRASFDPAPKGLERLKEQVASVKPTVCIIGYGMASSLEALYGNDDATRYGQIARGDAGVAEFKKQLGALIYQGQAQFSTPAITFRVRTEN